MGRLVKRGDTYHAHYYVFTVGEDGSTRRELRRESTNCSDFRAAQQRLAQLERTGSDPHRQKSKWRVAQLCEWYLTTAEFKSPATFRMRQQKLANVARLIGHLDAHTLTKKDVKGYIDDRRKEWRHTHREEPVSHHTIHKELVSLSQALKLASDMEKWDGLVSDVMPRHAPEYTPRETWLDPDQYRAMHSELQNDRDKLWCDVAVYTMGRYSEVSKLTWTDFNWPHSLNLRGTKTKKSNRWVPLHPGLRDILEPIKKDSGLVVGTWRNVYRALRVACKAANVPVITPNDLRRTGISLMIQSGANMKAVADIAGHANTTMVERVYAQMNMKTKEEAMEKMPAMQRTPQVEAELQTVRWKNIEVD